MNCSLPSVPTRRPQLSPWASLLCVISPRTRYILNCPAGRSSLDKKLVDGTFDRLDCVWLAECWRGSRSRSRFALCHPRGRSAGRADPSVTNAAGDARLTSEAVMHIAEKFAFSKVIDLQDYKSRIVSFSKGNGTKEW